MKNMFPRCASALRMLVHIAAVSILCAALFGCGEKTAEPEAPPPEPSDMGVVYLMSGDTMELDRPCVSANEAVASCSGSTVTAGFAGSARVSYSMPDTGERGFWTVRVNEYTPVTVPVYGYTPLTSSSDLHDWASASENVATVDENGVITPVSLGKSLVTAVDDSGERFGWDVTVSKAAYLTFDDWPCENTVDILNVLDRYGVKATFFLAASNTDHEYYQMVVDSGNSIGNHSKWHNQYIYNSEDNLLNSIDAMDEWLTENYGVETRLFRYPGGYAGGSNAELKHDVYDSIVAKGYRVYDWSCTIGDTATSELKRIRRNYRSMIDEDCEVILMHNKPVTARILPELIEYLMDNDYAILPITENSPVYNFREHWVW